MNEQSLTLYTKVTEILRSGNYRELEFLLGENSEFYCPSDGVVAKGKSEVMQLLDRAQEYDNRGRYKVKLWCRTGMTEVDHNGRKTKEPIPVIYIHEDVFPPYHKTNMYLELDGGGYIQRVRLSEGLKAGDIKPIPGLE